MKKPGYILILFFAFACNSENAFDCIQTSGNIVQREVEVAEFERILVNREIELIIKEGPEHSVTIESGENLLNDVEAKVVGDELQLTDYNTCNYVREYGITKIYVTAPNIKEIRSSTQHDISSDGVLTYENLHLKSENFNAQGAFTVGDFRMLVDVAKLRIVANNASSFYISGQTEDLYVGFFAGLGRFEGENLVAQNVDIYHRGSNDMIVNPQQSLTGELRGAGDLISVNHPQIVDVEQFYIGQLIFDD